MNYFTLIRLDVLSEMWPIKPITVQALSKPEKIFFKLYGIVLRSSYQGSFIYLILNFKTPW
jgi:hypothetical protein